ncbi:hypothetical protein GGR50DRAFT_682719 [Xylaria sp. CBS 124048]|nr:hypothetical protein GGR50DRAFT_682719 [Xylaria sp. CBS 124048]
MPVVRHTNPNRCYELCPLLFWTIIYVGSRRYAKSPSLVPFLSEEIRRQVFLALGDSPLTLHTINAIILICSWIFPHVRFINDPSSILSSVTINAALLLGIHTGRGGHPEYSYGAYQNNYTDEEATFTWAGLNIVSQRVASYLGLPPIGSLFNQAIQNAIDGRTPFHVPSSLRVMLECQKFSCHVHKIVHANLEESSGVSPNIVQVLEDEWNILQGTICSERANDIDKFNALVVLLEIQIYYLMPSPGHNADSTKQHISRTYQTACSVLRSAQELDLKVGFLGHITHYHVRSIVMAICVICKLLRSSWMQLLDPKVVEAITLEAISIHQRMSVVEGDLPMRFAGLLRTFYDIYQSSLLNDKWRKEDPTVSGFPHRLAASVTYDCLTHWKADSTATRTMQQQQQQQHQNQQPQQQQQQPQQQQSSQQQHQNQNQQQQQAPNLSADDNAILPSTVPDPLIIDWSFMDDLEWAWTPSNLVAPAYFWQTIPAPPPPPHAR